MHIMNNLIFFKEKKLQNLNVIPAFNKKLIRLSKNIDDIKKGSDDIDDINNLLKLVDYNLIPKSIGSIPCDKERISKESRREKNSFYYKY